ncbi:MAG: rRNA (guanosine2251-2-O)-methyltransferase [Chloroflexota bacterium]|nr:rRNA (guanosine2251-2-O)-methyltransferase [Chloroflexota bacterium]
MNEEFEGGGAGDGPARSEPAGENAPAQGAPQGGGAPLGDDPNNRRPRRRGRRGRGGGTGQPFPSRGPMPQGARPPQPFRGPARGPGFAPRPMPRPVDDEGSLQARELAAYERRQQQQQRRTTGGWRPGAPFRGPAMGGGGPRPFRGGGPQYSEQIRRATSGPARGAAPSHEAGEPIAGPHAVLEAMRAGRAIRKLYIAQDRSVRTGPVNDLIVEAQERRIFVNYLDKLDLSRLSPIENHQGVVAIFEGRAGVDLDELLVHLDAESGQPLVLIVDSLQDPQNFGVLLRSAEGAGVAGVVIPRHRSVGLTPAVAKTSAGASEHLLVAEVANLRQAIDTLKEKGLWVVGTDETGDLLYDEVDYRGPTALVIGGEGEGIRRLVLEGCDQVVRIPMEGRIASLNAAAAGTVVLYEALRQRRRDVGPPGTQTPRPQPAEGSEDRDTEERETEDLAETPELEDELSVEPGASIEEEPVDDLVAEDGEAGAPVEAVPVAKAPRKTAAKKTVKKTTKKAAD